MGSAGSIRKSERVGMLWWGGTVFVHFNLRKKAYVPGECIQFNAQIINDSKSNLHKAKLLLTQVLINSYNFFKYFTCMTQQIYLGGTIHCSRRFSCCDPHLEES